MILILKIELGNVNKMELGGKLTDMELEHVWMDVKNEHPMRNYAMTPYSRMYYDESSCDPLNPDHCPSNLHNYFPKYSSAAYMNYPAEIYIPDAHNGNSNRLSYHTHPNHFRPIHATGSRYCRFLTNGKIRNDETDEDSYHEQQLNTCTFQNMYALDERFNHIKQNVKKKRQPNQAQKKYMNMKDDFSNEYKLPDVNIKNNNILQLQEFRNPDNSNTITHQSLTKNSIHMHKLNLNKKNQMEKQHGLKKFDSQIMSIESNNSVTEQMSNQFVNTDGTSIKNYKNINLKQENSTNATSQYNATCNSDCKNNKIDINTSDNVTLNQETNATNNDTSINCRNLINASLKENTSVIINNPSDMVQNNDLECQESVVSTESYILQPFFEGIDENGKDIIVMLAVPSENLSFQESITSVPAETEILKLEDDPDIPQNFTEQKDLENSNCQKDFKNEALQIPPKEQHTNESKLYFSSNIDDFAKEEIVQNSIDVIDKNSIQNVHEKYFSKSVKNNKNLATSKKRVTITTKSVGRNSTTGGFKNKIQQIIDQELRKSQENVKEHSSQKKFNQNKICTINIKQTKPKWKQHFQWKTKHLMTYQNEFLKKFVSYYRLKNGAIKNDMVSKMLKVILNKIGANMLKSMHDISQGIINSYTGKRKSKFFKASLNKNTQLSKNKIFARKK